MKYQYILIVIILSLSFNSCDFLLGKKKDDQVNQVFEQGRIDPKLYPTNIGYVPVQPIWNGFSNPKDVFVGFDEMVYVIDDNGVHILDLKGEEHFKINILGATDIIQDRRQHTYVCGRILKDIDNNGTLENLPAVYHFYNASSATGPIFVDTLIHPFCDATRNIGYCNGLNPTNSNLKSTLDVASIATAQVPPQQYVDAPNWFYLVQQSPIAEYKVLQIKEFNDVDAGTSFGENQALLNFDYSKADKFLYQSYRFKKPSDVYVAPDATGYVFVVDEQTDSLYQFTPKGFEGVNPAANSGISKQIIASFGGHGNGPFQFNQPSGVCYFKRVIYVADKGNNRICRFKLSSDLE